MPVTYDEARSNADKIDDAELKGQVVRGIELLRERYGPDFVDHLDPKTLMMDEPDRCILGQLYGNFVEGQRVLDDVNVVENGFESGALDGPGYAELQGAWLRVLGDDEAAAEWDEP